MIITIYAFHMRLRKECQQLGSVLLLLGAVIANPALGPAQGASAVTAPFTLQWTEGACKHCGAVQQLGELRVTRPNEVWAVASWLASEGEGTGERRLVHTVDAGKTWKELRFTRTHSSPPSFSFTDPLQGWVSGMAPVGDMWVYHTPDGGRHWFQISDQVLQAVVFFDEAHAYGTAGNHFLRSSDGGRNWAESELAQLGFIDRMFFLNRQTGWMAGSEGADAVILRTTDGGQKWEEAKIPTGSSIAEIRDVRFLDARQGWVITWQANEQGSHLFRTQDGGLTWKADPDTAFQGAGKWLSGVRFASDKVALGFGRQDSAESKSPGMLLYSSDAGDHWQEFDLPRWLDDCQALEGDLTCSALSLTPGLWLLKIHPTAGSR